MPLGPGNILFHDLNGGFIGNWVVHLQIYILFSMYVTLILKRETSTFQLNAMCGPCLDPISYKPTVKKKLWDSWADLSTNCIFDDN